MSLPAAPARPEPRPAPDLTPRAPSHLGGGRGARGPDAESRLFGKRSTLLALPFGSTPLDSEEGRDFLQRRLRLFSSIVFSLSTFAFVATQLIQLGIPDHDFFMCLREHGGYWHIFAAGVSLTVWLVTRRGLLPFKALFAIDVVGTLLALAGYSMMSRASAPHAPNQVALVMMLTTLCLLVLRAVIIPSTLLHTVLVGAVGSMPVLVLAYYTALVFPSANALLPPFVMTGYMLVWSVVGLVISGVASQIIYGLRAQVMRAQRLGQYELDEKIGEGGMGMVYKARHALLRRPTAIKLVLPERAGMQLLIRFEREVQHTAMLTHPNTVSIYDYGRTPDGVFYYAMEYLDGIDLEQLVGRFGPLPAERAAHVLLQIAGSLAEAHGVGLVHRDIKPANVILSESGGVPDTAKVVDFGLVKDVSDLGRGKPTLSSVNAIIGTPLYLAPEAIVSPESVDARSDLYALGALGYFLLTGQPVFTGASVVEVCAQHLHAEPIPPSTRAEKPVPERLEALILACLAKQPEQRPASADQLLTDLANAGVAPWTRAQARAWWRDHGAEARAQRRNLTPLAGAMNTVVVDLAARAAGRKGA
jgi:serine/threonine-protein kinase